MADNPWSDAALPRQDPDPAQHELPGGWSDEQVRRLASAFDDAQPEHGEPAPPLLGLDMAEPQPFEIEDHDATPDAGDREGADTAVHDAPPPGDDAIHDATHDAGGATGPVEPSAVLEPMTPAVAAPAEAPTRKTGLGGKVAGILARLRGEKAPFQLEAEQRESSRQASLQQLKQGYAELVDTMTAVRGHLDAQSERQERMMTLLDGLPELMRTLPETTKAQVKMLEAIQGGLERTNDTNTALTGAISGLASATENQHETMSRLQTSLNHSDESRERLSEGIDNLKDTMGSVDKSTEATRVTLSAIAEGAQQREAQMAEMFRRSQRTQLLMTVIGVALGAAAIAMAGFVAWQLTQMQPPAADPAATTPPALVQPAE
ncbi:MAG: hypothetical protein AAF612_02100 [Planctomycetota bacterium]